MSNIYSHDFFAGQWKLTDSLLENYWKVLLGNSGYQGHAKIKTEPNKRFMCEGEKVIYKRQCFGHFCTESLLFF